MYSISCILLMLVLCLLCIAHCSSCVAHVCCVNTQIHSGSTHLHCLNCISSLFVVCFLMFATICSLLMCCSCLLHALHCSCVVRVCCMLPTAHVLFMFATYIAHYLSCVSHHVLLMFTVCCSLLVTVQLSHKVTRAHELHTSHSRVALELFVSHSRAALELLASRLQLII